MRIWASGLLTCGALFLEFGILGQCRTILGLHAMPPRAFMVARPLRRQAIYFRRSRSHRHAACRTLFTSAEPGHIVCLKLSRQTRNGRPAGYSKSRRRPVSGGNEHEPSLDPAPRSRRGWCRSDCGRPCRNAAPPPPRRAAEPIKIGFSMALTGGLAANGKQTLLGAQIWAAGNQRQGRTARPARQAHSLR